jgi:hypothetical protein
MKNSVLRKCTNVAPKETAVVLTTATSSGMKKVNK